MCDNCEFFSNDGWTSDDNNKIEPSEIVHTNTENADDKSTNTAAEFQMAIEKEVIESPPKISGLYQFASNVTLFPESRLGNLHVTMFKKNGNNIQNYENK